MPRASLPERDRISIGHYLSLNNLARARSRYEVNDKCDRKRVHSSRMIGIFPTLRDSGNNAKHSDKAAEKPCSIARPIDSLTRTQPSFTRKKKIGSHRSAHGTERSTHDGKESKQISSNVSNHEYYANRRTNHGRHSTRNSRQ